MEADMPFKKSAAILDEPINDAISQLTAELDEDKRIGESSVLKSASHQLVAGRLTLMIPPQEHRRFSVCIPSISEAVKLRLNAKLDCNDRKIETVSIETLPPTSDSPDDDLWESGMYRVFISHRGSQQSVVDSLAHGLKKYNIHAFRAHPDLHDGDRWEPTLERLLDTMDAMIVWVSGDYGESAMANQEYGWARGRQVSVAVLMEAGIKELPGFIRQYQALQVRPDRELPVSRVAEWLIPSCNTAYEYGRTEELIEDLRIADGGTYIGAAESLARLTRKAQLITKQQARRIEDIYNGNHPGSCHQVRGAFANMPGHRSRTLENLIKKIKEQTRLVYEFESEDGDYGNAGKLKLVHG